MELLARRGLPGDERFGEALGRCFVGDALEREREEGLEERVDGGRDRFLRRPNPTGEPSEGLAGEGSCNKISDALEAVRLGEDTLSVSEGELIFRSRRSRKSDRLKRYMIVVHANYVRYS